ncbi:hypothetical protein SDJN03_02961, partial [Cucurbita argyrosperma subsp. sororia]
MWKTHITSANIKPRRHLTDREIEDWACLNEDPEVVIPNYSLDMWRWNLERQRAFSSKSHNNALLQEEVLLTRTYTLRLGKDIIPKRFSFSVQN